jgi:ribonuclease P protein component
MLTTQVSTCENHDQKFSRKLRLSHPSEFKAVFQADRKVSCRTFALRSKKNTFGHARLGIVVAKRNVRRANARNLIKRIVRESFRMHQSEVTNFDIVVVIYQPYSTLSREKMRRAIDEKWKLISVGDKN